MSSYLNLITKPSLVKESVDNEITTENNLKDAIVSYAAQLDSSVNIYEALRKFIEKYTEDIDRRAELIDTLEFCEADEADLESTLIKLKIAMDNPVLSETIAEAVSTRVKKKLVKWFRDEWDEHRYKVNYMPEQQQKIILDNARKAYQELGYPEEHVQQLLDYILDCRIYLVNTMYNLYNTIIGIMERKLKTKLPSYSVYRSLVDTTPRNTNEPPKWIRFDSVSNYKEILKSSLSWIIADIKQEHSIADIERKLLNLQDTFFNYADKMPKETINAYEEAFEYLWNLADNYSKISTQEGLKMIDKDFLITESDVTKAVKTNKNDTPRKELDPVRCFVVLDKNDMPMLNRGGIVITNTPDAEQQIQQRADDLYRLIHNAKAVYMIEDEAYDQCVDIRDKKEYVKFVKANGRLIKASDAGKAIETHDLDDDDFLLDVEEMFE